MTVALHCQCGRLRGEVEPRRAYARAVCYCRDCRAFVHYLGRHDLLGANGGSDIVATAPASVRLTAGVDQLACMSLGPRGLLRWYASCCHTPVANTPRESKLPYVGLHAACLAGGAAARDAAFGPARIVLHPKLATGQVRATPLATAAGTLKIVAKLLAVRFARERGTPFFDATGAPVRAPQVITHEERARLTCMAER